MKSKALWLTCSLSLGCPAPELATPAPEPEEPVVSEGAPPEHPAYALPYDVGDADADEPKIAKREAVVAPAPPKPKRKNRRRLKNNKKAEAKRQLKQKLNAIETTIADMEHQLEQRKKNEP